MSDPTPQQLSAEQKSAVESRASALVVAASAGSGKTEVVARRVERILTDSLDESFKVLALSYTLKAADEISERMRRRLGGLQSRVDANTIHGFAHSLLRQYGTRIGLPVEPEVLTRQEDKAELLAQWLLGEGSQIPSDFGGVFDQLDVARARLKDAPYKAEWGAALSSSGAVDYAEMLTRAEELLSLKSARRQLAQLYGHVIVDEAQNLTPAQYSLLVALVGDPFGDGTTVPLMLVGDDKQSIVGFAGADPGLMSRFEREYGAERIELTQNFRSAQAIVELGETVAMSLSPGQTQVDAVTTYAAAGSVDAITTSDEESEGRAIARWVQSFLEDGISPTALAPGEAATVRPEEIAVLARSAAALRSTEGALRGAGISVAVASSPEDWLATTAAKVAYEFLALRSAVDHQSTWWQLQRLLKVDSAELNSIAGLSSTLESHSDRTLVAIAPTTRIEEPAAFVASLGEVSITDEVDQAVLADWEADVALLTSAWSAFEQRSEAVERTWGNFRLFISRQQRGDDLEPGVRLLTVHKAQGREYRAVALVGLNEGQLPDFRAQSPEEIQSELRAFYVAVTRASRVLLLSRAQSRKTRYGPRVAEPSQFLDFLMARDH